MRHCAAGTQSLIAYVGGHGMVVDQEHYTVLGSTVGVPDTLNSLWMRQLATVLASSQRHVVLFVDTCFSGAAATNLEQALRMISSSPTQHGLGVIAACRACETTDDGAFVEALLLLLRQGPQIDPAAWGPQDETIRLGALVAELRGMNIAVTDILAHGASELRIVPNGLHNPLEPEGRVHLKLTLRHLSSGAEGHLLDRSDGFVGRTSIRGEIVAWLGTANRGMFVITGAPGTGKSALMGLLARQSVGDHSMAAADAAGPPRAGELDVPEGTFTIIVHARQKTLDEVKAELARALRLRPCTVLVDALDEAVDGEAIGIADYLRQAVLQPGVRIVVGTRGSPVVGSRLGGQDSLLNELDADVVKDVGDLAETSSDISLALRNLLQDEPGSPYAGQDVDDLVGEVVGQTAPSFLFAASIGRWLVGQPRPITDSPDWRARLSSFAGPHALGVLVEEDLATRFPEPVRVRFRDLFRALAWAEGIGLPRYDIWPTFATALSPTAATYDDAAVTEVLTMAGWYLIESGEDGQTVFRLFHQSLIDYFREETIRDVTP